MYHDMKVLITNLNHNKSDYEHLGTGVFRVPVNEDEVREVLGDECVDKGNYIIEYLGELEGYPLFCDDDIAGCNRFYNHLLRIYDTCPDFPKLQQDACFHFDNGSIPFKYLIREFDQIRVINDCMTYVEACNKLGYDLDLSSYLYAFGNNRVFLYE